MTFNPKGQWQINTVYLPYFCRIFHIMQTYLNVLNFLNACQIHSVSSVCQRFSQIYELSFLQYMGFCVINLPIYFMMIVRICVLYLAIIIKLEVWSICHRLGLGHAIMVYAVYLFICSRLGPCVSFDAPPPHLSYPSWENTTRRCWVISDSPFTSWVGRVSLNWFQVLSLLPYQISAHIKCFTWNSFVI